MRTIGFCIALLAGTLTASSSLAQTCTKPCPSHQCAIQCLGPNCSAYCVRSVGPKLSGSAKQSGSGATEPSGDLHITIPNASPELAEKIRRSIEDR